MTKAIKVRKLSNSVLTMASGVGLLILSIFSGVVAWVGVVVGIIALLVGLFGESKKVPKFLLIIIGIILILAFGKVVSFLSGLISTLCVIGGIIVLIIGGYNFFKTYKTQHY